MLVQIFLVTKIEFYDLNQRKLAHNLYLPSTFRGELLQQVQSLDDGGAFADVS